MTANADLLLNASFAAAFSDATVSAGWAVSAVHITELRAAINRIRADYSLPAVTWTDLTITPGQVTLRAVHFTEMRSAILASYAQAGRSAPTFTDSVLLPGVTPVRALHLIELRNAVRALE